jgi:hypothetical protein
MEEDVGIKGVEKVVGNAKGCIIHSPYSLLPTPYSLIL